MTATLHTFPHHRVVRLPDPPRVSPADLEMLRRRWPSGWHQSAVADGTAFDCWCVPSARYDLDASLALVIVLQPSGVWTLSDDACGLLKEAASLSELIAV